MRHLLRKLPKLNQSKITVIGSIVPLFNFPTNGRIKERVANEEK